MSIALTAPSASGDHRRAASARRRAIFLISASIAIATPLVPEPAARAEPAERVEPAERAEPALGAQSVRAVLDRFACEPDVGALQKAAARQAEAEPERMHAWEKRARWAALLPTLRGNASHGPLSYAITTHASDIADRWRFSVGASWRLDRLVFDRSEVTLEREAERLAERRDAIYAEVAKLYFARRRLEVQALADPPGPATPQAIEHALAIDELTAVLDGLTGGALTHPKGALASHD